MTAISQKDVIEILRRAEIAREICGWSEERHSAFCAEIQRRAPAAKAVSGYLDPEEFGLDDEFVEAPGPDRKMSADEKIAYGAYQAEMTLREWASEDAHSNLDFDDPEACASYAHAYMDHLDIEASMMDEDGARLLEAFPLQGLASCYDGDPAGWLRAEHANAVADGRIGYEDIILQKLREPCVYMRKGAAIEIADGWHRTAAALVLGNEDIEAVEISVPIEEDFDLKSPL